MLPPYAAYVREQGEALPCHAMLMLTRLLYAQPAELALRYTLKICCLRFTMLRRRYACVRDAARLLCCQRTR